MLMFTRFLGKIDEWTLCSLEVLNGIVDLFSIKRIQTRNQSFDEIQLSIVPKFTDEEFTHSAGTRDVTTQKEFVLLVEALFLPEIDFPAWFILRTFALCHHALNVYSLYRRNYRVKIGIGGKDENLL